MFLNCHAYFFLQIEFELCWCQQHCQQEACALQMCPVATLFYEKTLRQWKSMAKRKYSIEICTIKLKACWSDRNLQTSCFDLLISRSC